MLSFTFEKINKAINFTSYNKRQPFAFISDAELTDRSYFLQTIRAALRCTLSICSISLTFEGFQIAEAYSKINGNNCSLYAISRTFCVTLNLLSSFSIVCKLKEYFGQKFPSNGKQRMQKQATLLFISIKNFQPFGRY